MTEGLVPLAPVFTIPNKRVKRQVRPIGQQLVHVKDAGSGIRIEEIDIFLPRLLYQPISPETRLSLNYVRGLESNKWGDTWMPLVPARIGSNRGVDLATQAVMMARLYTIWKNPAAKASSIRFYVDAIDSLQSMMRESSVGPSDDMILTIALLSAYESISGPALETIRPRFLHMRGLSALLRSFTTAVNMSEVAVAIFYHHWTITFLIPVAQGVRSPFECPSLLMLDPPSRNPSSPAILKLRKIANQLFIHLPSLIVLVRALRNNAASTERVNFAIRLGRELFDLQDQSSENELLHLVHVTKSQYLADVIPTRMLLIRLCSKLQQMFPEKAKFDLPYLKAENCRIGGNILMSWEHVFATGAYGTGMGGAGTMAFVLAMVAVWGCLTDVDTFRSHPSTKVQLWVLQRIRELIGGIKRVTPEDMDEMAELFKGGPCVGILPSLVAGV